MAGDMHMTGDKSERGDRALRNGVALEVPGSFVWRVLEVLALPAVCYLVARAYAPLVDRLLFRPMPFGHFGSVGFLELMAVTSMAMSIVLPVTLLFVLSVYLARHRYGLGLRELG